MPPETNADPAQIEVAYVLFLDIVGYSKLLVDEQRELITKLNEIVRNTAEFKRAVELNKLICLATGDGMALVYSISAETPVKNALEISAELKNFPEIQVRMGIHSGPVSGVSDVNQKSNVAGAGINIAQRVMDCGDGGHILLSKHIAEDLDQSRQWRPHLHPLGEVEVKHGLLISIVNLYTDKLGNSEIPQKIKKARRVELVKLRRRRALLLSSLPFVVLLLLGIVLYFRHTALNPKSNAKIPEKSIAVLPFENLSSNKENVYFTDGVQDEILTDLANIADLKVISRTSVMQYKPGTEKAPSVIGSELGVAHLLEGSVQRAENRVRVNAQLIDTKTDANMWAHTYDRDLADVFAIQSEIAKTIAEELKAKLSPQETAAVDKAPTNNLSAYDFYVQAKTLYYETADTVALPELLPKEVTLLNQAVKIDPNFLLAWYLLARAHGSLYGEGFDHTPARLELMNTAVQNALRIQPDSGEAHLALGVYYYSGFRDYDRAAKELKIAETKLPNNAELFDRLGHIEMRRGNWAQASKDEERSLDLDPRNFLTLIQASLFDAAQRRYTEAIQYTTRALDIKPGDSLAGSLIAEITFDSNADIKAYQKSLANVIAADPASAGIADDPEITVCERSAASATRNLNDLPPVTFWNRSKAPHKYFEGLFAYYLGDLEKAKEAFTAARIDVAKDVDSDPSFAPNISLLGIIDAGLGRKEDALREGRLACDLLPTSKDAYDGTFMVVNLARIYAMTGEKKLALDQLEALEKQPNQLTYGRLKMQPYWDPLRQEPRYQKILESIAPKPGQ